jgi:hypothetical protein
MKTAPTDPLNSRIATLMTLGLWFMAGPDHAIQSEVAVRNTLLQIAVGLECNNLAGLSQLWANDESVTVFENGHANYG